MGFFEVGGVPLAVDRWLTSCGALEGLGVLVRGESEVDV